MNNIFVFVAAVTSASADRKSEFELLVKKHMKRAYYSALGLLGNHDDAMELSQEAFIRAYSHFYKFDPTKKFFTWYYKILKNLCLNRIRDNKNRKEITLLEEISESNNENVEESIEKKELKITVENALMELKESDREILILKEFENLSYKEISELMEIPIGSVMSKLFYARKKLAVKLKGVEV
jgi:RNA polymerase sigma-70 factor (ECF subfamily)